jgi:hypothetical protein
MLTTQVLGKDMINGQRLMGIPAILAFPIIAPENFQPG